MAWSKYLDETIAMWGDKGEVMYGMHHWPVWGNDRLLDRASGTKEAQLEGNGPG